MENQFEDVTPPGNSNFQRLIIAVLLILALSLPLLLILAFSASFSLIVLGAAAWSVALCLKVPLILIAERILKTDDKLLSLANGMLSALSELGIAACCFIIINRDLPLADIIGFGIGASSIEILFTLLMGAVEERLQSNPAKTEAWSAGAQKSLCVRYMTLIERVIALLGHVGSRGLIYLSIAHFCPGLAAIAFLSFSVTDGAANYGGIKKWNWFDPGICRSFYSVLLLIGLIEISIFIAGTVFFKV